MSLNRKRLRDAREWEWAGEVEGTSPRKSGLMRSRSRLPKSLCMSAEGSRSTTPSTRFHPSLHFEIPDSAPATLSTPRRRPLLSPNFLPSGLHHALRQRQHHPRDAARCDGRAQETEGQNEERERREKVQTERRAS
ncbi:hypothetical protein CALVIDRAFT_46350 [Calocera viscosa TUFC12733]|uniref:Uncharacterized protein n=1 Tax=Calocera viscosa (strain TUFC12733) TaxID=1330018 RepID=A0A167FLF2_CALVF|nr:hypothetical protein CALVIDRAFT_46350 [Calocera viscosa TUFC12733]